MQRPVLASIALLALVACDAPRSAEQFPYRFEATSDGEPVAGARVSVDGADRGVTGADGRLDVTLEGVEGDAVTFLPTCPSGYRGPSSARPLSLHRLRALSASDRLRRVRIAFECRPEQRTAMLLIRADGLSEIPVLVDGREVGRTDEFGLAHVPITSAPNTTFDVVLQTEHLDDVLPRNPPHTISVPDADEVFVIDQSFTRLEPDRPRRPRVRPTAPTGPTLPQKIVTGRNPPTR